MKTKSIILIPVAIIAFIIYGAAYTVDETEQVVITQFGRIVGQPKTDPGLKFKIPFIQKANYFNKNLLQWDGDPGQIPTLDKTFIWVDTFARWKIVDPIKFFQTVNNRFNAIGKLNDIIDPAVRNFITSHSLIEAVRSSNRELETEEVGLESETRRTRVYFQIEVGRQKITQGILEQAQPKLTPFGIELVDVKLKRINYVEEVRKSVYGRMIAERNQIAEKFRSEGKGEAQKILGEKERDLQEIESEAFKRAQKIKGDADAQATIIYAEAYGKDPEFYSFVQTMEIYRETLGKNSLLVLSTDSEFLKYLKGF
ncbi:MAG: protease modulator HflC [Deltaproteobacteria bacterium]|jgi:membrane protease subunit HflC|nr:protease modulator HflC [Deltaproteobacteria bacterium]MBW2487647.1 protease modulator HflC [Deltaproteobacteria bacterium]MBW2516931.1 protease modulator HflC [Deltaproteobacteria bacterium]